MRAAVIDQAGAAVNVVLVDEGCDYDPGEGLTVVAIDDASPIGPGWFYDGETWTEPEPVPAEPTTPPPISLEDVQAQVDELWDHVLFGGGL